MRNLESRLWDKKKKCMIYAGDEGYLANIDLHGAPDVYEESEKVGQIWRNSDEFIPMLTTTREDIDKKPIFEGDVLEFDFQRKRMLAEVKWGLFGFICPRFYNHPLLDAKYRKTKVIGNIHENPELKKKIKAQNMLR